ncbi:bifunctional terpene synthase/polyprenyl synthetase family protein [Aspergillus undulatus]|uniref:bifunctional terpene synthase/polyprenyl synthetase family protein n=1 Tax=Aspergillus undulatus TaxID=1810928 RepID=UPI003CCE16B2
MDKIGNYCQHSEPITIDDFDPPPADWFCLYPLRRSKYQKTAVQASDEYIKKWNTVAVSDGLQEKPRTLPACQTPHGNYVAWAYPESIPDRVAVNAEYCDFAYFWDDVSDLLSKEQCAEVTQDLALTVLAEMGGGPAFESKFGISKLALDFTKQFLGKDGDIGMNMLRGWGVYLDAQTQTTSDGSMSFEQLKKHRYSDGGVFWGIELGCWVMGIRCTQEEKDSIKDIMHEAGMLAVMTNDYYSFNKEFDDLSKAGTLDRMKNALGMLMRDYGYTEEEARSIMRQEINTGERAFMDAYDAWEAAPGPKSHELRRYWHMCLWVFSGSIFWMAHGPRYHHEYTTTAEDRATIVGKSNGPLRVLERHPPPKDSKMNNMRSVPQSLTVNNGCTSAPTITNGNGTAKGGVAHEKEDSYSSFIAPFVKAPSNVCTAPYEYIASLQSKNMRNRLIDSLNAWLQAPSSSIQIIKNIVHGLHNASLMLDDIEDNSLRRGQPATHVLYGASQTINSANFAFVRTVQQTTELRNPKSMGICLDELSNLHCGQSFELYWRHHARCPTADEYIMMADNKTGGLFRLIVRLMEAESPLRFACSESLTTLFTLMGRYYQIKNDYLNLKSADYTSKKGFLEDFGEGKFSLPLIHLLNNYPYPDRITAAIYNRAATTNITRELKKHILEAMESARTFDYVRGVLKYLHEEIMRIFDALEKEMGTNNAARVLFWQVGL